MVQTLSQGMQLFLQFANICIILFGFYKFLGKPHYTLEERIKTLEAEIKDLKDARRVEENRYKDQHATNEVLIKSVLALVEFEINSCLKDDKEVSKGLEEAKEDLHSFLSKRGGSE